MSDSKAEGTATDGEDSSQSSDSAQEHQGGSEDRKNWDAEAEKIDQFLEGKGVRSSIEARSDGYRRDYEKEMPQSPEVSSLEARGSYGVGPENPMDEEARVEDSRLESALEEAKDRFGTDYISVFDEITWKSHGWEDGILGLTEFQPADSLEPWERPEDGPLSMEIDRRLSNIEDYQDLALPHVIGHEGIHGEWFRGIYGSENREYGMPIETLMAAHAGLKQGGDALEAVTEYTARMRNPDWSIEMEGPYEEEVNEFMQLLDGMNASMTGEQMSAYEGPGKTEELNVKYVDADIDYYLEHGELNGEEYVLALGDHEKVEDYLNWAEEQYEQQGELEKFEYDSPLGEETMDNEMPDMQDYGNFLDRHSDQYDRYDPDDDPGTATQPLGPAPEEGEIQMPEEPGKNYAELGYS